MFYGMPVKEEIYNLLVRYQGKLDLTEEEFRVVSAYVAHSGYYLNKVILKEIASISELEQDKIKTIFTCLIERNILKTIDDAKGLDNHHLFEYLKRIKYNHMSLTDKLVESYSNYCEFGKDKYYGHKGQIEVIVHEDGGIVVIRDDVVWNKKDMLELAEGIKQFADTVDQNYLDLYNKEIENKKKQELEIAEIKRKQREEELEEKKRRPPKSGFIFLLRLYPSGHYKFTYTTDLSKEHKISQIKEQYQNLGEIIHVFDVCDTSKFYHQFLKKQLSNRLADGTTNEYELTEKDIEYLKQEQFPGNAMDWLDGLRSEIQQIK